MHVSIHDLQAIRRSLTNLSPYTAEAHVAEAVVLNRTPHKKNSKKLRAYLLQRDLIRQEHPDILGGARSAARSAVLLLSDHDDAFAEAQKRGILVIDGVSTTRESAGLESRVLRSQFKTVVRKQSMQGAAKAAKKRETTELNWEGMLQKSKHDVTLACEGHTDGLAFVTGDIKFYRHFKVGLDMAGVTTYLVLPEWLESKMTTTPPSIVL
ncbi:hypothetical protein TWF696_001429 [Orbilia brochopaga]|uniref:PIN domain-containing protein n=1 Tax=Orbilia brochopaga TaxID=3140254 RepID=A0AAV9UCM5_9PEZI